eukprot:854087-Rhodomonas_salina.2
MSGADIGHSASKWEAVLPAVLEALGGASEEALIQLPLATSNAIQPTAHAVPEINGSFGARKQHPASAQLC